MRAIRRFFVLIAVFVLTAAASWADGALKVSVGYFGSGEEDETKGAYVMDPDEALGFGVEYVSLLENDTAVSASLVYSAQTLNGNFRLPASTTWTTANANAVYYQLSAAYLKFEEPVRDDVSDYEGVYYGVGIGYSQWNREEIVVGGSPVVGGDFESGGFDLNLILGYKFEDSLGAQAKWIVDEKSLFLAADMWF